MMSVPAELAGSDSHGVFLCKHQLQIKLKGMLAVRELQSLFSVSQGLWKLEECRPVVFGMLHVHRIRYPWELPRLCLCYHKGTAQGASGFKILKSNIHNLGFLCHSGYLNLQLPLKEEFCFKSLKE